MIRIKKGLDIPINGSPADDITDSKKSRSVAILGNDYVGMKPTMLVEEGERVKLGQPLFEDKKNPGVIITSPAGGKIESINRGERRVLQSIVIEIEFDEELALVQKLEEGWTHTSLGNKVRSWNFTYISPSDNTTYTDITINGNAVNGNDQSTGDALNSAVIRIPGTSYTCDPEPSIKAESLGTLDYAVGSIAIFGLLAIAVMIIKD